jgi:hypothetical protein
MSLRPLLSVAAGSLLVALATPAAAQSQAAGNSASEAENSGQTTAPRRRICVLQQFTGSRLPRKICKTQQEWDREGGLVQDDQD